MENRYGKNRKGYVRRSEQIRRQEQRRRRIRMIGTVFAVVVVCVLLVAGIFVFRRINKRETPISTSIVVNEDSLQELMDQLKKVERNQYTTDSLTILDQRMLEAQTVIDSSGSQKDMDSAYMNLITALQGLVPSSN